MQRLTAVGVQGEISCKEKPARQAAWLSQQWCRGAHHITLETDHPDHLLPHLP